MSFEYVLLQAPFYHEWFDIFGLFRQFLTSFFVLQKKNQLASQQSEAAPTTVAKDSTVEPPSSQGAPSCTISSPESSSNKASAAATGALADILDLDFGAVNRQYILDDQTKTYSTREPLRPSNPDIDKSTQQSTLSSNSSTSSSTSSRKAARKAVEAAPASTAKSAPDSTATVLRDTKIEIAGKRPFSNISTVEWQTSLEISIF